MVNKLMKRFFFYLSLFIGGIIGFSGWIVANCLIIQPGGVSSIMSALRSSSCGVPVAILFALMATSGLILAIINLLTADNN